MSTINPSEAQLAKVVAGSAATTTPIRMLNLLNFRDVADYGDGADPAGDDGPTTGAEAYRRYGEVAVAEVTAVGGSFFFTGVAEMTVIGPADEEWDMVAIVEYPSRAAFLEMVSKPSYRAGTHHRDAALADTRIVMMSF